MNQELKNCKDCIAFDKCPSGKRNPITRVCISDEELIKSQIKEIILKLAETVRGEE